MGSLEVAVQRVQVLCVVLIHRILVSKFVKRSLQLHTMIARPERLSLIHLNQRIHNQCKILASLGSVNLLILKIIKIMDFVLECKPS